MYTLLLATLLLQPIWALPPPPSEQGLQVKLRANLENYTVAAETFPQALTKVAAQFEIPMGIEWIRTSATQREIRRSWRHTTVYGVVESLVKSQSGYDFAIANGVIHVFPKGALMDRSSFLNHRINKFEAKNEFAGVLSYRLRELLKRTISPPLPSSPALGTAGSIATGAGDRRITFRLVNASVRQILDKLSLATDFRIWIVTYPEDRTLTETGFRRVASLYTSSSVADNEQPVWAFLRWGDALPK
jgi:hypothetical protein